MLVLALSTLLSAGQPGCSPEATAVLDRAAAAAAEFDLEAAASQLDVDVVRECESGYVASLYARGLVDAQAAFRQGAPPEALAPVRQAIASLEALANGRPGTAAVAHLMLQAAAAAAQSERDEMQLYLESAIQMELVQRAARQPGAPLISASEVAGDLWLQVHRYEDARRAYTEAAERVGFTARVLAGLARSAERLGDMPAACTAFGQLLAFWGARQSRPSQIAEARAYVVSCLPAGP